MESTNLLYRFVLQCLVVNLLPIFAAEANAFWQALVQQWVRRWFNALSSSMFKYCDVTDNWSSANANKKFTTNVE